MNTLVRDSYKMHGSNYHNEIMIGPTNGWLKPHPELTYSPQIHYRLTQFQIFPLPSLASHAPRRVVKSKITLLERTLIDNWTDNPRPKQLNERFKLRQ